MLANSASDRPDSAVSRCTRQTRCAVLKPFRLDRSEILHLEQQAGLGVGDVTHHDRVGRRERLQPSGQIHGFADRHQFPCRTGAHKVANQDKAARDADPYRQMRAYGSCR